MTHVILMVLGIVGCLVILAPNRRAALWYFWPFALLMVPTWMSFKAGSVMVNARGIAGSVILLGLIMRPDPEFRAKLRLPDVLNVLLAATIGVSMYMVKSYGISTTVNLLTVWILPYLMGRFLLRSAEDVRRVIWMLMACTLLLTLYAVVESFTGVNVLMKMFGIVFKFLGEGRSRLGLRRAQSVYCHPIYHGLIMMMMLPWAIEARRLARARQGPFWWRAMPIVALASLFFSLSKSAWATGLVTVVGHFFFTHRRLRIPMLILAVASLIAGFYMKERIIDLVHSMASGKQEAQLIVIDGEYYVYTGSRHRILLFVVYEDYLLNAGWFGYGPGKKKVVLPESLKVFNSVDDHYIVFTLQYGYAGLALFLTLALVSQCYLLRIAWPMKESYAELAGALLSALVALDGMLLAVWFAPDFALVWLFSTGAAVSLYEVWRQSQIRAAPAPAPATMMPAFGRPGPFLTALPRPGQAG